jgi:GT2 family glycosyltransferase
MFFSHDMLIPPACVTTLLQVAAIDPTYGIVRPTSRHMDTIAELAVDSPLPLRNIEDVDRFSSLMSRRFGVEVAETPALIGDAMLIRRDVIERIGVTDTRFFGFMADVDYGVRAERAGFKLLVARGAWLHHSGGAALAEMSGTVKQQASDRNLADAVAMLKVLHDKWGLGTAGQLTNEVMNRLVTGPSNVPLHQPPPRFEPDLCESL